MRGILFIAAAALVLNYAAGQALVYPESDTNENRKPQGHNRVPVVSPKCAEGELLYPGDNQGDWACDCKPAYVYYPSTAKCYPVLSKGPCQAKEILVLPVGKVVPKCEANKCDEGKFPFYNVCTKLESFDGCKQQPNKPPNQRVYLNATSLQLYCSFQSPLASRFTEDEPPIAILCAVGSKCSQAQENSLNE